MPTDELSVLRRELARHDREIARAVAARLRVARRIGDAKRRRGRPIRNRAVERQVLRRWADDLEAIGVPAERAHLFARWLVEEAVRVQELSHGRSTGPRFRVLVVGGAGGMGRVLGDRLRAIGHAVRVLDPAARRARVGPHPVVRDLATGARWAEIVVVATPIAAAPSVYRELWASGTRATVLDIFSVKSPILSWIALGRRRGYHVASAHPLFGPSSRTVAGELVLLVDCGDRTATARAGAMFRSLGVVLERLPLRTHDAWMADLQVLPRLAGLSFLFARGTGAKGHGRSGRVAPPSFRRQLEVSARLAAESPDLSFAIQAANPHARAAARRFAAGFDELRRLLERGDLGAYARRIRQLAAGIGGRARPAGQVRR